jgi:hypothetical protein
MITPMSFSPCRDGLLLGFVHPYDVFYFFFASVRRRSDQLEDDDKILDLCHLVSIFWVNVVHDFYHMSLTERERFYRARWHSMIFRIIVQVVFFTKIDLIFSNHLLCDSHKFSQAGSGVLDILALEINFPNNKKSLHLYFLSIV